MNTSSTSNEHFKARVKDFFASRKRFFVRAIIVFLVFGSAIAYANERFILGLDPQGEHRCLPWVFYVIDTHQTSITKDQYFAYSAMGMEPIVENGHIALKKAAGAPGDQVVIEQARTWVEGMAQPNSHLMIAPAIEHLYESKEALMREIVIPEGEIFALGTLEGSYDSRYWGNVKEEQIIGRAFPIF